MRVCSRPGCPTIYEASEGSQCQAHRREGDRRRGTAQERGYTGKAHRGFRDAVLRRDPICCVCGIAASTVADHYPLSRKELIDAGMNPNDPAHGRGLCAVDHNRETAIHQPGGWNAR